MAQVWSELNCPMALVGQVTPQCALLLKVLHRPCSCECAWSVAPPAAPEHSQVRNTIGGDCRSQFSAHLPVHSFSPARSLLRPGDCALGNPSQLSSPSKDCQCPSPTCTHGKRRTIGVLDLLALMGREPWTRTHQERCSLHL